MKAQDFAWYAGGVAAGIPAIAVVVFVFGWTVTAAVAGVLLGLLTGIVYTIASLASGWPSREWWAQRGKPQ